jgi:hypothetical protein
MMRNITPASARYPYFRKQLVGFFEDKNFELRIHFSSLNCSKKASSTASNNYQVKHFPNLAFFTRYDLPFRFDLYLKQSKLTAQIMSFIQAFVAKADVALPRYVSVLNLLSVLLLALALFLPLTSSVIVLVVSTLIQAAFFRVMHRKKAGLNKLLNRLAFLVISSAAIVILLFQHREM